MLVLLGTVLSSDPFTPWSSPESSLAPGMVRGWGMFPVVLLDSLGDVRLLPATDVGREIFFLGTLVMGLLA